MPQPDNQDPERGNVTGISFFTSPVPSSSSTTRIKVDCPNPPSFARVPNQPSQGVQGQSILGDSSAPLFTMYSKIAEEEDKKMVEQWQQDAKGIIIFVCPESALIYDER